MKKLHQLICSSLLLLGSASAIAADDTSTPKAAPQATTPADATAAPAKKARETYENKEKNYSINYPGEWQKKEMPKLDLVLFAPSKDATAQPQASMNIVSEKVDTAVTLDQFYSESITNLSSALKEVHIEKNGDSKLNGVPSKWVVYTHVMQGIKFEVLQYFMVANGTIYLITFSATADAFDGYRAEFEQTANSFRLLTSDAPKAS